MTQAMLAGPSKRSGRRRRCRRSALPTIINKFKERFGVGDDAVDELISMQLNVGVLLVRPNGQVALPHAMCALEGAGDPLAALRDFVARLKQEPLLLKAYTAQAIVSMQDRLGDDDVKPLVEKAKMAVPEIDEHFDDLSKLSHSSLRQFAITLLENLAATEDSALIKLACTPSSNASNAAYPAFSASKLLLQNAHCFPGMTLTVSADPKTRSPRRRRRS